MGAAHGIEGSFVVVHEFMAKGLGLKGNSKWNECLANAVVHKYFNQPFFYACNNRAEK